MSVSVGGNDLDQRDKEYQEREDQRMKERRMRFSESEKKEKLEIHSRSEGVILARVKVRTSTFSFYPSVVYLAEKLLWLFQFGRITLYSPFHYLSELMWKNKRGLNG